MENPTPRTQRPRRIQRPVGRAGVLPKIFGIGDQNLSLGFHPDAAIAKGFYRGCSSASASSNSRRETTSSSSEGNPPLHHDEQRRIVDFIILGAEKAGTTSIGALLEKQTRYVCRGTDHSRSPSGRKQRRGELHFFNDRAWATSRIPENVLEQYAAIFEGNKNSSCGGEHSPKTRFEKTPRYSTLPWVPLRMCESLGRTQKVVMFLRNPITRTYSAFWQFLSVDQMYYERGRKAAPPSLLAWVTPTAEGFDRSVRMEIALLKACGGLPTPGNLTHDVIVEAPKYLWFPCLR